MSSNKDKNLVFVNDVSEKQLTILRVEENFQLVKESVIDLPLMADNIEYDDESDEILIGTIPDIISAAKV